jgi:hypothetical protein
MLTWEDCVAWCELNEDEIEAIAQHEHIPKMAALALGAYLCQMPDGQPAIRRMILEDIAEARAQNDRRRLLVLLGTLKHFVATHPKCRPAKPAAGRRAAG